ncbi:MAG: hypothetical protein P1U70_19600 [Saprospiraceae bacterium]|nr:hypothetical protein [Saprospiraceae bacterium]
MQSLSMEELRKFKKFVQSPFFNTNEQLVSFFNYLYKYAPKWDSRMFSKEIVFRTLFPDTPIFDSKKMGNLMSELSLLFENFIVQIEFDTNPLEKNKIKLKALSNRNLTKSLEKQFRQIHKTPNTISSIAGKNFHLSQFEINHKLYFDPSTRKFNKGQGLKEAMNHLDHFYFINKLQMGLEMKVIERVIGEKHDNHFLDAILNLAHGIADDEEPSLKIYFYLVRSNQARQLEDYTSAKRLFIKHIQDLNNLDRFAILLHLINFAVTQSYSSEKYWLREILDLYILGLEQKILIQNNNISPAAFTNIVINGIKLKEYDWLDYFIQHYKPYLDSDHREQIEVLCQASIFFAKEDFSNVTRLLTSHSFPKPIYKIRAKSVLLKTIYEELSLDDSQLNLFEAQSKSFERFLRRASKLTERESYINFVQILRKIAKARQKNLSLDKFLTKIKYQELQHMNIANKSWVLAKVEDFIQAKKLQKAGLLPS